MSFLYQTMPFLGHAGSGSPFVTGQLCPLSLAASSTSGLLLVPSLLQEFLKNSPSSLRCKLVCIMYTYIHAYLDTYTLYIYIHTYTYTHIQTHAHTHTHTHRPKLFFCSHPLQSQIITQKLYCLQYCLANSLSIFLASSYTLN